MSPLRVAELGWARVGGVRPLAYGGAVAAARWARRPSWTQDGVGADWSPELSAGAASRALAALLSSPAPAGIPDGPLRVEVWWAVSPGPGGRRLVLAVAALPVPGLPEDGVPPWFCASPPPWFDRSLWPEADVLEVMSS